MASGNAGIKTLTEQTARATAQPPTDTLKNKLELLFQNYKDKKTKKNDFIKEYIRLTSYRNAAIKPLGTTNEEKRSEGKENIETMKKRRDTRINMLTQAEEKSLLAIVQAAIDYAPANLTPEAAHQREIALLRSRQRAADAGAAATQGNPSRWQVYANAEKRSAEERVKRLLESKTQGPSGGKRSRKARKAHKTRKSHRPKRTRKHK